MGILATVQQLRQSTDAMNAEVTAVEKVLAEMNEPWPEVSEAIDAAVELIHAGDSDWWLNYLLETIEEKFGYATIEYMIEQIIARVERGSW